MPKNINWNRARNAAKNTRARKDSDFPPLPIGTDDCWCGEKAGHDWPGKDDGEPHPKGDR